MAATDLFNSTKGKFGTALSPYTTLIGGKPPSIADWQLDKFSGTENIEALAGTFEGTTSGLKPKASVTSEHSFGCTSKTALKNFVTILEYATGTNAKDFKIGAFGRYISESQYLYAIANNSEKRIEIYKKGTATPLATAAISTLSANTTYWLVVIFAERYVRVEHYVVDPRANPSPAAAATHALSSADRSTFDVASATGVANWVPISDNARVVSLETGQAFVDATNNLNTVIAQKHVDIRDFVNYRYPLRYRSLRELKGFHITEKAFSQLITLTQKPTSGTFTLLFYPSDATPYAPEIIGGTNGIAFDIGSSNLKKFLNDYLNLLPKFSVSPDDPIKNVVNSLNSNTPTLLIEFNETFGDLSLLRMDLSKLDPALESEESYDSNAKIGTFVPVEFDQGYIETLDQSYIETADPIDPRMTLDDLRIAYKFKNENWTLRRGYEGTTTPPPGTLAPLRSQFREETDLIIGKIKSQENRTGGTLNFSRAMNKVGARWSVYLQSATKPINCVAIGSNPGVRPNNVDDENLTINMVFAGFPWDPGNKQPVLDVFGDYTRTSPGPGCFIQFTSSSDGQFSTNSAANSNPVAFKDHMFYSGSMPSAVEFIAKLSEFNTNNTQFDFSRITGVRIFLAGNIVSTSSSVSIMAIRCVDNSIVGGKKWLSAEINTIEQTVTPPVLGHTGAQSPLTPMISGMGLETTASDPSPIDSKQSLQFRTGLKGSDYNRLMLFAREIEYDQLTRSAWLTAEYAFKTDTADTYLRRYKTTRVKSENAAVVLYWDTHPGGTVDTLPGVGVGLSSLPVLSPELNFELSAQFVSNSIKVEINELNSGNQTVRTLYDAEPATSGDWAPLSGRIGWYVEFADKDMQIEAFDLDSAGYAVLRTKPFLSETPIEGAQLFTVDSGNKNLFERFYPLSTNDRLYIDNQKSTSGLGSFVLESFGTTEYPGLVSNEFVVDDWSHMFIEFDIWVPYSLRTDALRPKMLLRPVEQPEGTSGVDVFSGIVPVTGPYAFDFTPGAWSTVSYDLRGTNAKNGNYYLVIVSDGDGLSDESVFRNKWWIDNIKINTQTVEWEIRAIENGSWTPFKRNINLRYGALHLSENQIGRYVQLQARALTEDAWIAEYTLIPKYRQLGRFI